MSGVEEEDEAVESMLFVHRSVNIYKIPPRVGLASYRFASRSFAPYVPSDFDRQNGLSPNPLENPLHSLPRFESLIARILFGPAHLFVTAVLSGFSERRSVLYLQGGRVEGGHRHLPHQGSSFLLHLFVLSSPQTCAARGPRG